MNTMLLNRNSPQMAIFLDIDSKMERMCEILSHTKKKMLFFQNRLLTGALRSLPSFFFTDLITPTATV
jgi:hypothetical protein